MKILIVGNHYHPFVGGVEAQMQLGGHELKRRGHDVEILAARFIPVNSSRSRTLQSSLLAPRVEDFFDEGLRVHALTPTPLQRFIMLPMAVRAEIPRLQRYFYNGLLRFSYPWYLAAYRGRLRRILKGVDIVHSHSFDHLGWAVRDVAASMGIPFVCTPYVHPQQWGDNPPNVEYYRKCDKVIGLLPSDVQSLQSLGVPPDRLTEIGVIPRIPCVPNADSFRTKHQLHGYPLIVYVGRMMVQKGAKTLLAAAPEVWKKHPQARFVFIGPPLNDSDSWFAGADPRILHLGRLDDQERLDAMAACDLFAMPSSSEILPGVYLESWTLGKPVIAGPAHGLKELVADNGAGLVVEQNPSDVSTAVNRLLDEPALARQMGETGLNLVREKYSLTAVVNRLEQLYSSLVADKKGTGVVSS